MTIKKSIDEEHVKQLLALFPKGDPDYFRDCLQHYDENPVERITEKIIVTCGGQYPQLVRAQQPHDNYLNACLCILALDLFPDCDISYLRDQLHSSQYAPIESVVDKMLEAKSWPERLEYGKMDPSEGIRSERYKKQAQLQLVQDFPQIWKSSIRAVLAENNWDYIECYDQLKEMGSGGFWNTLRNFFMQWSTTTPNSLCSNEDNNANPVITDYHLKQQFRQLKDRVIQKQITKDQEYAQKLNITEYTDCNQLIVCDCCYSDYTFEQLLFCTEATHAFCHDCITHYISEGLFGQGSIRGQPRINCIGMDTACSGCLPTKALQTVLSPDIWKAYENSLLQENNNLATGSNLVSLRIQCCACNYFELDESSKPIDPLLTYLSRMTPAFVRLLMWDWKADLEIAYMRLAKTRRGTTMFVCRNKECKALTCLECHRPVRGPHKCWEKETDGLRLYVEKAMADAVKRTCPNCFLSFQKSDGCNKITCRCGYTMCYVCRKDILKESYAHFCDHFRERPGTKCTQCIKCDLYKTAPEEEAVQLAATRARDQYLQVHPEVMRSNISIGPKSTLDKIAEWKKERVLWCLERVLNFLV